MPAAGLTLSKKLAEKLDVGLGDRVTIEVQEGRRPIVSLPVVQLFETYFGMLAYTELETLNRLLLEPFSIGQIDVRVDSEKLPDLFTALKGLPEVSAVTLRRAAIEEFHDTIGKLLLVYITFFAGFACALGGGVVYNAARIALSERGRELATLRVLGFSRWEISYILLGEVALLTLLALPLGCLVGQALAYLMTSVFETELFRVPLIIQPASYGWAVLVALAATLISAALVRQRLDSLDLIAVLKTRE